MVSERSEEARRLVEPQWTATECPGKANMAIIGIRRPTSKRDRCLRAGQPVLEDAEQKQVAVLACPQSQGAGPAFT
jgi:hypothetical protein